jgi:hypothetical protein
VFDPENEEEMAKALEMKREKREEGNQEYDTENAQVEYEGKVEEKEQV